MLSLCTHTLFLLFALYLLHSLISSLSSFFLTLIFFSFLTLLPTTSRNIGKTLFLRYKFLSLSLTKSPSSIILFLKNLVPSLFTHAVAYQVSIYFPQPFLLNTYTLSFTVFLSFFLSFTHACIPLTCYLLSKHTHTSKQIRNFSSIYTYFHSISSSLTLSSQQQPPKSNSVHTTSATNTRLCSIHY